MRTKCHTCLCQTCLNVCKCEGCTGKKESCDNYNGFRQLSIFGQEIKQHMRILVACEESQRVCIEFRKLGHEAYSCDIEPCSGGHEEWHIQNDVLPLLNGNCEFQTADSSVHCIDGKWDMIIAFPPCTYLTSAGTRHYSLKCNPVEKVRQRELEREKAADFFLKFANADCEHIAIENPVGYMNTHWRKPNQIIHPYYFGDNAKKRTCVWLKGLPELKPTNMLPEPKPMYVCKGEKCNGKKIGWCEGMRGIKGGQKERAKARSKTFPGIANAMAEQWGKVDDPTEPQYQSVTRHSWQHYGISKERYRKLTEYIQSGRYASVVRQAAHRANETIAEYLIMSIAENKSYDALMVKWELKEMERIPYCRTDFYGIRRYFYSIFDKELRRIGK